MLDVGLLLSLSLPVAWLDEPCLVALGQLVSQPQPMIFKWVKAVSHISFGRVIWVWKRSAALITT